MERIKARIEEVERFSIPRSNDLPDLDFYMDQVISIMEKYLYILAVNSKDKFITPSMINNYVKLGIIPPPHKKRYTKEHICYLFIICTLKSVIPIPAVLAIINTELKTRSIFELYDTFCECYEGMVKEALKTSNQLIEPENFYESALSKLSLFMAISASTTQLVANNALTALIAYAELPEKENKEKDKKASKK